MAIVVWASLRQLEALRSSFLMSLTNGAIATSSAKGDPEELNEWAEKEELDPRFLWTIGESDFTLTPSERIQIGISQAFLTQDPNLMGRVIAESTATLKTVKTGADVGAERSSAYWDRFENFVTTSVMLRFLATLEQFEIDTLKALLFHRPQGKGIAKDECKPELVDESVIEEIPTKTGDVLYYEKPVLWTWLHSSARINNERRKIFNRVYDIRFSEPKYKDWKKRSELYEMRNAIAHGHTAVKVTVGDVIKVHGYVAQTIIETQDAVSERYNLIL